MISQKANLPVESTSSADILVLGIDSGTTSFKVAVLEAQEITEGHGHTYIVKDPNEQVIPLSQFPGYERFDSVTVPTSLIYDENGKLMKWGHHAVNFQTDDKFDPKYLVECWKIGLRTSSCTEGIRIRTTLEATAERLGKSPDKFIEDFFAVIRQFILENEKSPLVEHLGGLDRLQTYKYIDVVIALPPGWPRQEHRVFCNAVTQGLGPSRQLRLFSVSETECVLNQWITKPGYRKKVKAGDVVILSDLGGGTACISAFHLVARPPEDKQFRWEHIESHSLTAGSQIVTEAFMTDFQRRLEETSVPLTAQLIHRVRKEFDEKKLSIGEESPERDWPVEIKGLKRDDKKRLGSDKMWFAGGQLLEYFDTSQTQILDKMNEMIDRVGRDYSMPKFCVLAGAYGNNVIFKERLRKMNSTNNYNMDLQFPQYCGEAVVRGACLARAEGEFSQASGSRYSVAIVEYRPLKDVRKQFPLAVSRYFSGDRKAWTPVLAWKIKKGDIVQANHRIDANHDGSLERYFDPDEEVEFSDTFYTSDRHPGDGEYTYLKHKTSNPDGWKRNEIDLRQRGIEGKAFEITWELRNVPIRESDGTWGSMSRKSLYTNRGNKKDFMKYKYYLTIGQIDVKFSIESSFKTGTDMMDINHKQVVLMDEPESVTLIQEYENLAELEYSSTILLPEADDPEAKRQKKTNGTSSTELPEEADQRIMDPDESRTYSPKDANYEESPTSLQITSARGQLMLTATARHSIQGSVSGTSSPSLNQNSETSWSYLTQSRIPSSPNSLRRPRQETLAALKNPVAESHKRDFWAVTSSRRNSKRVIDPFK